MEIIKKRIRSLSANLPATLGGSRVLVASPLNVPEDRLVRIGLRGACPGDTVLPTVIGPVTRFNAEGREIVHRDQPKETRYRQVYWTWIERHGQNEVEQSDVRDVPYERYPRSRIPPPSVEITVVEHQGETFVVAPELQVDFDRPNALLHTVNVFLEAFGSCRVLRQDMEPVAVAVTRRLNWTVLPPGRMPWERLRNSLQPVIDSQRERNRPVVEYRLERLNSYHPDFVAVGLGGFSGYVIFGYPERGLYVLECTRYGNATYVFGRDWETLAQLTKAEVLSEDLQIARYVHRVGWPNRIDGLFRRRNT